MLANKPKTKFLVDGGDLRKRCTLRKQLDLLMVKPQTQV